MRHRLLAVAAAVTTSCGSTAAVTNPSPPVVEAQCRGGVPAPGFSNGITPLPNPAPTLTGAGSSFVAPMMSVWAQDYAGTGGGKVAYQSLGSSAGVAAIQTASVDFGDSDAFMSDAELARAKGPIVQIPLVQAPVVAAYNVPGVGSGLKFDGPTLGYMFSGEIKQWNDPAIAALNPGVKLPHLPITVIHRSDGSGTTFIWTDFLTKEDPYWVRDFGGAANSVGKSIAWPLGIGGKGNEGVSALIDHTRGAIGYLELTYAVQQRIAYGYVKNRSGNFVVPCVATAANAAKGITRFPSDLRVDIVDESTDPNAYPATGLTWALVYRDQADAARAAALVDFFSWVLTRGEDLATTVNYTPLTGELQALCMGQLRKLTVNGRPVAP